MEWKILRSLFFKGVRVNANVAVKGYYLSVCFIDFAIAQDVGKTEDIPL